jgi:hypothetical protein
VGKVTKSKPQVNTIKMGLTIGGQSVINPNYNDEEEDVDI